MNAVRKNNRRTRSKLSLAVEPLESRKLLSGLALDPHFGTGGKVVTDFNGEPNSAFSLALTGGKMLVAGSATFGGDSDFALVRYNADGSLDTSFGAGGLIHTDFGSTNDEAYAMAIQSDGKIVVVGHTRTDSGFFDFAVARYNADGSLDTTFGAGHNGKMVLDFGGDFDQATAVAVQSDGKIVVSGTATINFNAEFALLRLTSSGLLDASFGAAHNGTVLTDWNGRFAESSTLAIQPNGKILVGGYALDFGTGMSDGAVARYNADGSLDASFGVGGMALVDFGRESDNVKAMTLLADGRIMLAGYGSDFGGDSSDFAVARLTTSGALDATFGSGGVVLTDFGGSPDQAFALTVQFDGMIVVAGTAQIAGSQDFAIVRYTTSGALDSTFGVGGKFTTDMGNDDTAAAVALDSNGNIVAAGSSVVFRTGDADFALIRLAPPNVAPVANAGGPYSGADTAPLSLSGANSYDPDGSIVSYEWDFNYDGSTFDVDATSSVVSFPALNGPVTRTVALRVTDDMGASSIITTTVTFNNVAPVANAGGPYVITDLTHLTLSGANSSDVDGSIVSYEWDFNYDGSHFDVDGSGASVAFPMIDGPALRTIALRVTDDDGATHIVTTTVQVTNVAPVANAGGPYVTDDLTQLMLSGAGSSDADGSIASYEWDFNYNGSSFHTDASGVNVAFPMIDGPATRTVALRVTDNDGATHIVTTTVQVTNVAPVANAGGPYVITDLQSLTLSGAGSSDADGSIVSWEWDFNYDGSHFDVDGSGMNVAFPHVDGPATRTVALRVTDNDGATHLVTTTVQITNVAPIANAGGPYVISENAQLTLSGSNSSDADGSIVSYEWDFNYDGSNFHTDSTGMNVAFPMLDGPTMRTVALRVTDNDGATHMVTTTVQVENAAPVASISGPSLVRRNSTATFTGSFYDPMDTHEVSWDFGDGTVIDFHPGDDPSTLIAQHSYARKGVYTVTFTVRDDDGACSSASMTVEVKNGPVQTTSDPVTGLMTMTVTGTQSADTVNVKKAKRSNDLEVIFNGESQGVFQADRVIIYGTGGNDVIRVGDNVMQPVEVFGGAGDDVIMAGKFDATLHGEAGNDKLFGGAGKNVLDGGDGNDLLQVPEHNMNGATLMGGAGNDILHGGKGKDVLDGGDGDDHLNGRGGADLLMGGAGKDQYVDRRKDDTVVDPDEVKKAVKSKKAK